MPDILPSESVGDLRETPPRWLCHDIAKRATKDAITSDTGMAISIITGLVLMIALALMQGSWSVISVVFSVLGSILVLIVMAAAIYLAKLGSAPGKIFKRIQMELVAADGRLSALGNESEAKIAQERARAIEALEALAEERASKQPKITLEFFECHWAFHLKEIRLFARLRVINAGVPTETDDWKAVLLCEGTEFVGNPSPIILPDQVVIARHDGTLRLGRDSELVIKHPGLLTPGKIFAGWVMFNMKGIVSTFSQMPHGSVRIEFQDAFGKEYSQSCALEVFHENA